MQTVTAKLFTNGRSQAVRLPKGFRFEGVREVRLERDGDAIVLRPVVTGTSVERLIASLSRFENLPERAQPGPVDEREPL